MAVETLWRERLHSCRMKECCKPRVAELFMCIKVLVKREP